jgi:glucuronoarabinoxylan endo-1,4-beta-xylanase
MLASRTKNMTSTLASIAITAIFLASAGLLKAQNLITNPGFENNLTGWSNATSGGASASFAVESSLPYTGARAMRVAITNPGTALHNVQSRATGTSINLPIGTPTTVTFRARASIPGVKVRFVLQDATYHNREFTLSTSWARYAWNHTTTEANPELRIQFRSAGTVWLDDISVEAHPIPSSGILLTLDPSIRHQTMDGFGGALTWNAIRIINLPSQQRNEVESMIFDDLGLDIIRLKNWYYPDGYPASKSPSAISPAWERNNFNANQSFVSMARKPGRRVKILLSSWSPPENLKSNNDRQNGGTLKKNINGQFLYADFAQYWVDLLDNLNWTPDYLSFQNEPDWVAAHETCEFAPTQTATKAGLAEAIDAIHARIRNRPDVPILIGPESESTGKFLEQVVPLRSRPSIGIYAFHNYNIGDPSLTDSASVISNLNGIRSETSNPTSGRPNWMSEFSRGAFDWLETAHVIHNTIVEANASAYIYWALAWASESTPATPHPERVFSLDTSGTYARGDTYFALKHFAKYISRGHQRFEVSKATGTNPSIRASAYLHPAGNQVTLVVLNIGDTDDEIALRFRGLPIASATSFRTRKSDIGASPFEQRPVNPASNLPISKKSITTFVFNLATTLNPYDPALLRVNQILHQSNQVSLAIPAQPGHNFILWKSSSPAGPWLQVSNPTVSESDGESLLTDPNPSSTRAFYRVQRAPNP